MASLPPSIASSDSLTIHLAWEELQVSTREVDTGRGVRLSTTVTERIEEVDQLLRHQDVQVERVVIDRIVALDETPVMRQEGATLIVPIVEEVLVVEKRLRIKAEVRVTRVEREERHVERVPLKAEQLVVERFDEGRGGHPPSRSADAESSPPAPEPQQAAPAQAPFATGAAFEQHNSARHNGLP